MLARSSFATKIVPDYHKRDEAESVAGSGAGGRGPSLRAVLALSLAGVALAATMAMAALVTREATGRLETEVGTQLSEVAAHMAANLDQGLFERWRDIQIAATFDTLRSTSSSPTDKRGVLQGIQQTYSNYSIVGLVDAAGRVTGTSLGILEGVDVSNRDYFVAGQHGPYVSDVHEAMLLARAVQAKAREPLRLIDVAAPIKDATGGFAGVLVAHLNWSWAREMAEGLARSLKGHRAGSQILVLDKNGTVLLGPPDLQGKPLPDSVASSGQVSPDAGESRVDAWPDDGKIYVSAVAATTGYREYPGLGWRVVVRQRADRALAAVTALRWGIFIAGGIVALATGLIAWFLAGSIARPLGSIALAAEALGRDQPLPVLPDPVVREGRRITEALVASAKGIRRRETTQRLLIDELNHRVKNTLATVQSMAMQSFRDAGGEAEGARRTFEARLLALSAAHNVLTGECWRGADVREIIAEAIKPFDDGQGRIVYAGPVAYLSPQSALALSMLLHELATNAIKHGALSLQTGCIDIAWTIIVQRDASTFSLSWMERGGPPLRAPTRKGFGTRLLKRGLDAGNASEVEMQFTPEGLIYRASLTTNDSSVSGAFMSAAAEGCKS